MWVCREACDRKSYVELGFCHKSNVKCGFVGSAVTENGDLSQDSVTRGTKNVGL